MNVKISQNFYSYFEGFSVVMNVKISENFFQPLWSLLSYVLISLFLTVLTSLFLQIRKIKYAHISSLPLIKIKNVLTHTKIATLAQDFSTCILSNPAQYATTFVYKTKTAIAGCHNKQPFVISAERCAPEGLTEDTRRHSLRKTRRPQDPD